MSISTMRSSGCAVSTRFRTGWRQFGHGGIDPCSPPPLRKLSPNALRAPPAALAHHAALLHGFPAGGGGEIHSSASVSGSSSSRVLGIESTGRRAA
uniref:Uncharacterized protein n=1 Tax=Arundo donax TaxID=35708 RepID=A0A0A9F777_ARUDO